MLANKTKHVAPCYPYRHRLDGETNRAYGQRLSEELEDKIIELGSQNVAGFIIEPVVGAVSVSNTFMTIHDGSNAYRR